MSTCENSAKRESEALMAAAEWSSVAQKNGSVTFTACRRNGNPIRLRIDGARIVFEPSCYGGDGTEIRKNICFAVTDEEVRQTIQAMEESLSGNVSSCIKDDTLRTKISMDKARFFDVAHNRIEAPKILRGCTANAMVTIRGRWETRTMTGLCLETTDIQLVEEASEPMSPFR